MKNQIKTALFAASCVIIFAAIPATAQVPGWATGTFTARNPYTGGMIYLTIEQNGRVTANIDGGASYGTFSRERLTIDGVTSKVKKINNGIRTTRIDNNERIDYIRSNGGDPGWGGGVPSWAVGTFYGSSPQNGTQIALTISNNGSVTATIGGSASYGTLNGTALNMNGAIARISRNSNGITTTRTDNGEQIFYSRDGGGGWNPGNPGGGQQGNVPNWAVGTFYASNPQTGGIVGLTISGDGGVTVNFVNSGGVNYASMYRDQLTVNGVTSKVTKLRNRIRTTRLDNGERIDYTRRER